MGFSPTRTLTTLALLLALPLGAQEEAYRAARQPGPQPVRTVRSDDGEGPDQAWGRQQWWLERMGGKLGPAFTQHLLDVAAQERAKYPTRFRSAADSRLLPTAAAGSTWSNLGPTGSDFTQNGVTLNKVDSGRPRVILPDTADVTGNTVYLLAAGGGLWKTTDFLSSAPTWAPLTDFVGSNMSGSAAFGRTTSTLYVGSGDPFDLGVGGFMITSTNGGTTWTTGVALGTASKVMDVKVDTSQSQDIVLVGTDAGLFRSINGGTSYGSVATLGSTAGTVWSLAKTSVGWLASAENTNGTGSLYLSVDQGATWSPITNAGTVFTGAGRTTLAVAQPGDSVVYAYAANTSDAKQLDLFKSTDGGQTWVALGITTMAPTNPNSDQATMDLMADQAWYNQMVLVDPTDASRNTVYLGGQLATAKTVDGGKSWTLLSDWLPDPTSDTKSMPYVHADCHCAAFSTFGGQSRIYFGTDGGLFTSTNGGTTWDDTKNKGLITHLVYSLAANTAVSGSALIGVQDNGTRIRSGTTSTFNQVRGGDGFGVGWSQANNAVSLSSYVYDSIERSTTNPVTDQADWVSFTSGLGTTGSTDKGTSYYFVTPICTPPDTADPSGEVFFTYSNNGTGPNSKKIFESNATTWTAIGTVGTGGLAHAVRSVSHGVGVSPTDLQHIAVAGLGGYLPVTTNGGRTWTEAFLGAEPGTAGQVPGWQGYNANVAWANNSLLYVCSESPGTGATRVAKSLNGGATWVAATTGLPDIPVTKLAVDPGDATGNTVYAATWLGVYKTTNGGSSWSLFGTGLPQGRATDIWVAPDSSAVRVATWGRGVWELNTGTAPKGPAVSLSPSTVTLVNGGTQSFTPTVTGGTTNTVTWTSINGGTVPAGATATGAAQTYTAPASGTTDTVTVTTVDTPIATAQTPITLVAPSAVSVAVSPATAELLAGAGTLTLAAAVSPLTNQSVTWSGTGVSTSGVFSAAGLAAGSYTVTATSTASPTSPAGSATVTLIAPSSISVTVSPATPTVAVGGTLQFNASVAGPSGANQGVTWTVSGGGTISTSGLFTATTAGSSFTVTATSTFDPSVSGSSTLTVKSLDLNGDGTVDLQDLLFFAQYYGTKNTTCDLNGDGTVDDNDLAILLGGL
jgi:hypothetical protein